MLESPHQGHSNISKKLEWLWWINSDKYPLVTLSWIFGENCSWIITAPYSVQMLEGAQFCYRIVSIYGNIQDHVVTWNGCCFLLSCTLEMNFVYFKGTEYTCRVRQLYLDVLPPFWKRLKYFFLSRGDWVYRKGNRKSQKLSPLYKMYTPLKIRCTVFEVSLDCCWLLLEKCEYTYHWFT